jgi:hypothetical protein
MILSASVIQSLQHGELEERYSFLFQNLFFLGQGRALDVSLFGFTPVNFQGLLSEIQAYVLKILVHIFGDDLENLVRIVFFAAGLNQLF